MKASQFSEMLGATESTPAVNVIDCNKMPLYSTYCTVQTAAFQNEAEVIRRTVHLIDMKQVENVVILKDHVTVVVIITIWHYNPL
jgi:hypothetical protein